jgi:general stress protein CsbA
LLNIYYKERTAKQSSITRITVTVRTQNYTTGPIYITTAIYIIAARYKQATSLYYKVSIDSNSLIIKKISAETTSRINKL